MPTGRTATHSGSTIGAAEELAAASPSAPPCWPAAAAARALPRGSVAAWPLAITSRSSTRSANRTTDIVLRRLMPC